MMNLPAITPQKALVTADEGKVFQAEDAAMGGMTVSMKKKKKDKDKPADADKPLDFDYWVRCMDINHSIYYYNSQSGESTWLAPCSACYKHSDKWCSDCSLPFCDKHFQKKHSNLLAPDGMTPVRHKWSTKELPNRQEMQTVADPNVVKCIECNMKRAVKMCLECWDGYCMTCFDLVHHVGSLKLHASALYDEVISGWVCVRTAKVGGHDDERDYTEKDKPECYYVHGTSKETTYEKPPELMSSLEKTLLRNWKTHQAAAEKYVKDIDSLQYELEKARYERDQLMIERVNRAANKEDDGAGKALTQKKGGKDDPYLDKLMHPSNRNRGEGRSNYIKGLLEAPLPS